jgi:propanol-preferring alcohol dehydrogenase
MQWSRHMPTMKAAIVPQFGKPLVIEDVPVPQPGADLSRKRER